MTDRPLLPLRHWLVRQGLLIAAALVLVYDWGTVWLWHNFDVPRDPQTAIDARHPGYRATVAWLREHGHRHVRTLPYETDIFMHQRLIEMLYPIEVLPAPLASLRRGEIAVVGADAALPLAVEDLFTAGALRIVQVR